MDDVRRYEYEPFRKPFLHPTSVLIPIAKRPFDPIMFKRKLDALMFKPSLDRRTFKHSIDSLFDEED